MQALKIFNEKVLTMTSREIADLTGKEHRNVLAVVRELAEGGVLKSSIPHDYKNEQNGQKYPEFLMDKRDSLVLVARLSPEFTAAMVDRWQELENKNHFNIPQTFSEALKLAAEQAEQLQIQAPMIAVYDALANRKGDVSTTVLSKQLGVTAFKLNAFLREHGIKWLNADLPKAGYETYFNCVSDVKNGHEFTQCLVTPHGQIEIAKLWESRK